MILLAFGVVVPWAIVAAGCWLGYALVRQNGRILLRLETLAEHLERLSLEGGARRRIDSGQALPMAPPAPQGLPRGSEAPAFQLPDLNGKQVTLEDFRGRQVLFMSWDPNCGFCRAMAPDLAALPSDGTDGRPIPLVVSTGRLDQNHRMVKEFGIQCPVLLQETVDVTARYKATGTPMGYLIDERGNIASDLAVGAQALLALSAPDVPMNDMPETVVMRNGHQGSNGTPSAARSRLIRDGLPAGTLAPEFRLPRVDGGELSLVEYRGQRILLVFSDPNCGPCQGLALELERLHQRTRDLAVVMISRGDRETNRLKIAQDGLTFPVVVQRQWETSRDYGKFATPIGYLIDERGVIAADVATGADAILALANQATLVPGNV